jgi:hypothetical protein
MMVIRWKAIYDTLESAVDAYETVANVLEGITLKRAANGRRWGHRDSAAAQSPVGGPT